MSIGSLAVALVEITRSNTATMLNLASGLDFGCDYTVAAIDG